MAGSARNVDNWFQLCRDAETGIESVQAHFQGHAYDAHAHDEVLIGVTQHGVQRFRCHRAMHTSTRGRIILIEPGAVHDGHAPEAGGFTYAMLYIPQPWLRDALEGRSSSLGAGLRARFRETLTDDEGLRNSIVRSFAAIHGREGKLARDLSLNRLVNSLAGHMAIDEPVMTSPAPASTSVHSAPMRRARDYLHDHMATDVSLNDLVDQSGIDRFRLNRHFTAEFGQSPHAYLVNLRLRAARERLARGEAPAEVASAVGFADQSHLGRWFRRAFGMTPGHYQQACTNVL
ncbi:AraC family transcriptional regulator [Luteibacter aegosomatissinici]|uniref:AraC family transcriptional regulator n=1 Tax=Luteibacter aegosomatissinici TaxID=2911539 RepID=UPI001FF889C2|nr:AraC family transcriptional regulator [Luteibacter aegosomatissinici]UPG92611.1 AraC family transcriptional regulator [Luteibacter aegosomatissinici]